MKISNISPARVNNLNILNNQRKKLNTYIHTGSCDSVSFTSKTVSAQKLQEIKAKSKEIKENAVDILSESFDVKQKSYELLETAKEEYMLACQYIELVKRNIQFGECELDNGNTLRFNFVLENGNDFYLHIVEYDIDEQPIREIAAENFRPTGVSIVDGEDIQDMFDYNTNRVLISHNVNRDDDGVMFADMMSVFDSGRLLSVKTDSTITTEPLAYDKYYYFIDDQLITYSKDNITHEFGDSEQTERYNFLDGKILSYCAEFHSFDNDSSAWDEGYYYKNGKLIGHSNANAQKSFDTPVECEKAIFLNRENKFVEEHNVKFVLDDDGGAIFG